VRCRAKGRRGLYYSLLVTPSLSERGWELSSRI
jgi:hypothetical protein